MLKYGLYKQIHSTNYEMQKFNGVEGLIICTVRGVLVFGTKDSEIGQDVVYRTSRIAKVEKSGNLYTVYTMNSIYEYELIKLKDCS